VEKKQEREREGIFIAATVSEGKTTRDGKNVFVMCVKEGYNNKASKQSKHQEKEGKTARYHKGWRVCGWWKEGERNESNKTQTQMRHVLAAFSLGLLATGASFLFFFVSLSRIIHTHNHARTHTHTCTHYFSSLLQYWNHHINELGKHFLGHAGTHATVFTHAHDILQCP
jgi:hypothetical protein